MLEGDKVILREKQMSDVNDDYSWRCDSELSSFDAVAPMRLSVQEYMFYFAGELRSHDRIKRWFAIDTLDGKHIGNCMYYELDEKKKQAKVGIMIGNRDYWNNGYGTDAVKTLVNHVFDSIGLERVYLDTLTWNTRAHRCFEKCGFVQCGQVTQKGKEFLIMELKRSWRKEPARAGEAARQSNP